ncbi:muconolactone Delta-isomerase [Streptomyces sp. rh34]|uniref:muconolactone Delta-isomerase n=1 Tax=Streptomyces sp. rh34 TaxID=2034272 RepID=UPI0027BAD636|nr:muconolactone Delta-isomerase family protein [Streptomyces sp. rh34]
MPRTSLRLRRRLARQHPDARLRDDVHHPPLPRRAAELVASGSLVRMWRVPGRTENGGLWRAPDPTELHAIIASLPVWPWMHVMVHALADHPVDPGPSA